MPDFYHALSMLRIIIVRNSDWFIVLFAPFVIGQSSYFGIGFFESHLKTALYTDTIVGHCWYMTTIKIIIVFFASNKLRYLIGTLQSANDSCPQNVER